MPNVTANEIRIEYDSFGDRSSSPLLLIAGRGAQMIRWPEEFCEQLAKRGHYVIRFDNRDVGLSTKFEETGKPNIREAIAALKRGEEIKTPYTLDDMAEDAIGLLDALGIDKAHVCGTSMGGKIAQTITGRYPPRVRSLISMQSSTGDRDLPPVKPEAIAALSTPVPAEREAYIERRVDRFRILAGSSVLFDEQWERQQSARAYDRCYYPQGAVRQMLASLASGSRKQVLKSVTASTLVIHGSEDPIFSIEHAKAIAEAVEGAKLVVIEGMGHGFAFPAIWPRLIDLIIAHTCNADALLRQA